MIQLSQAWIPPSLTEALRPSDTQPDDGYDDSLSMQSDDPSSHMTKLLSV